MLVWGLLLSIRFASKKEILEKIQLSDIVLVVLDVRNPIGTMSSYLLRVSRGKRRLFVLNKADLVPREIGLLWERWFKCKGHQALPISANNRLSTLKLKKILREWAREVNKDRVIVMIAGVPKTGKSSIINVLRGKHSATVSAYPGTTGYTKGFTLFNIEGKIYAWDTPGVFPDVRDPLERIIRLKPPEKIRDPERIAAKILSRAKKLVPGSITATYGVDESLDEYAILEEIARKRGWLEKTTKEPIIEQAGIQVIRDYLDGKIKFYVKPARAEC